MLIKIINEQHWRELRQKNIGGSEVASLFSEQDIGFFTRYELWHLKSGTLEGDLNPGERLIWGNLLEDSIATGVEKMHGYKIDPSYTGYYALHPRVVGMGCTPDRVITHPEKEGKGVLQIKNTDRFEFSKWEEGEPPLKYLLQVQHEMACLELDWGVLAVLVGGNTLKIYPIERHARTALIIEKTIEEFWQSIKDGKEPPVVADDYDVIRKVHSAVSGEEWVNLDDAVASALCLELQECQQQKSYYEKQEKAIKASLLQKIGDAPGAICGDYKLSRKLVNRAGYTVQPSNYVQFSVKKQSA